jgi:hypothetical protein
VSEPFPEGAPLGPDELRRLTEMAEDAADAPDFAGAAIAAIVKVHAQWYFGWQAEGVPEQRAAEWAEIVIASGFRPDPS